MKQQINRSEYVLGYSAVYRLAEPAGETNPTAVALAFILIGVFVSKTGRPSYPISW